MKYTNLTRIFVFLFSVGLAVLSYFCLVVGIALSFGGNGWFASMLYVFIALAVLNIVGLFFVKKKIMVTVVINAVSMLVVVFASVFLIVVGLVKESPLALIVFASVFVIGAIAEVFAFLAKKKNDTIGNLEQN